MACACVCIVEMCLVPVWCTYFYWRALALTQVQEFYRKELIHVGNEFSRHVRRVVRVRVCACVRVCCVMPLRAAVRLLRRNGALTQSRACRPDSGGQRR